MAHYLVTGGLGFIGSHLAKQLITQQHSVTILDDLSTGKKENAPTGANVIIGSINNQAIVNQIAQSIDGCFHLAAIASVQKCNEEWEKSHQVNATGTIAMFEASITRRTPVVYASSSAIYGDNPKVPLDENETPNPLSPYGVDKLACEMHGKMAQSIHQIPTFGLRFFNVFGPRQDPTSPYSGVISIFANNILNNKDINIYGDGEQQRDFVFVNDVVRSLIAAMDFTHQNRKACEIINVCTGIATSINTLAKTIESISHNHVTHHYQPPRQGDILRSLGNPAKLNKLLNITATTSLKDGLAITLHAANEMTNI